MQSSARQRKKTRSHAESFAALMRTMCEMRSFFPPFPSSFRTNKKNAYLIKEKRKYYLPFHRYLPAFFFLSLVLFCQSPFLFYACWRSVLFFQTNSSVFFVVFFKKGKNTQRKMLLFCNVTWVRCLTQREEGWSRFSLDIYIYIFVFYRLERFYRHASLRFL